MGTSLMHLGMSEDDMIKMLNEHGGATPESIAKVIAANNHLMLNQINTLVRQNISEVETKLK